MRPVRIVLPLIRAVALALFLVATACAGGGSLSLAAPGEAHAALTPPVPVTPVTVQDAPEVRAVWVDAFHDGIKTSSQVDQLVAWARQANVNALYVQVRRRGDAYYSTSVEPRSEDPDLAPGFDPLRYLIERAHQGPQRLQVHAWVATLAVWNKRDAMPSDPLHVMNLHGLGAAPEDSWLMLRDDGAAWTGDGASGTYYLDPGNPDAARYTAGVVSSIVRSYDVDGIQLDQVRYFEGHGLDRRWGYNAASVARFDAASGRDPSSQPDATDPEWVAWRRDQVTALVRRIYLETKATKPSVVVSADVVAWGKPPQGPDGWEQSAPFSAVFQDWRYWLQEGIVDYLVPMDYYREDPQQASWLDGWTSWQRANQGKRGVVIGLGGYLNATSDVQAQIGRTRGTQPLGVALYSYAVPSKEAGDGAPGDQVGASVLRRFFERSAPVPDLPWISRPVTGNLLIEVPGREGLSVTADGPVGRRWRTDGTGLAGGVDVPPGRYLLTVAADDVPGVPSDVVVDAGRTTVVRLDSGVGAP